MTILFRSGARHLARHPWQLALAVLGVSIAVAVVAGVDLANASAERAFELSVEGVAGKATHEIIGGPRGIDEAFYTRLRTTPDLRQALPAAAPVVEGRVRHDAAPGRTLQLLGVDPFAEASFRGFTRNLDQDASTGTIDDFLLVPGAAVMGFELADELGLTLDDRFEVEHRGQRHGLTLVGLVTPGDALARRTGRDLIVVDVSTAQELLDRLGRLDRVDLIVETPDVGPAASLELLRSDLPPGVEVRSKAARSGTLDQMTRAFRLNLEALSLLALLVGMFLIYNTMTFMVLDRRPLLGTLRTLGVSRRQVRRMVLGEAAVIGLLGSVIGLALGLLLAQGLVRLVAQTINDLYFTLTVRGVTPDPWSLAKALALGLGGTVLATWPAAREAMDAPPRTVAQRSLVEGRTRSGLPRLAGFGVLALGLAAVGFLMPFHGPQHLVLNFAALFVFVLGVACLIPGLTYLAARAVGAPMGRAFGILGRLAARSVAATLSRTGVAVAALVIAVAMTIGVGLMVDSFRGTLADWLTTTLIADVYVSTGDATSRHQPPPMDPAVVDALTTAPGVAYSNRLRRAETTSRHGDGAPEDRSKIMVLDIDPRAYRLYTFAEGRPEAAWRGFESGQVLISEPYAFHHQLGVGDRFELLTDRGFQSFEVAGVYYNYASDRGLVTMDRRTYDRYFDDPAVEALGLFLEPDADADAVIADLRRRVGDLGEGTASAIDTSMDATAGVTITPNGELRRAALEIFDRTFVITGVLRLLALAVAFLGVLGALMALQLERARELATLRVHGLTPGQVWGLVSTQTGLLGFIAGLLSMPLGVALAVLLIDIINRRSFGWSLQMDVNPAILVQALLLAMAAALLAGLYPSWKLARTHPARALREE